MSESNKSKENPCTSPSDKQEKIKVDKSVIDKSIAEKQKALATNQIIKK
jgi:hypothetical protein